MPGASGCPIPTEATQTRTTTPTSSASRCSARCWPSQLRPRRCRPRSPLSRLPHRAAGSCSPGRRPCCWRCPRWASPSGRCARRRPWTGLRRRPAPRCPTPLPSRSRRRRCPPPHCRRHPGRCHRCRWRGRYPHGKARRRSPAPRPWARSVWARWPPAPTAATAAARAGHARVVDLLAAQRQHIRRPPRDDPRALGHAVADRGHPGDRAHRPGVVRPVGRRGAALNLSAASRSEASPRTVWHRAG